MNVFSCTVTVIGRSICFVRLLHQSPFFICLLFLSCIDYCRRSRLPVFVEKNSHFYGMNNIDVCLIVLYYQSVRSSIWLWCNTVVL